jgi:hypothetical protein
MRKPTAALGLVLVVAGAFHGLRGPRLTMVNTGLRVDYHWPQGAALLAAALGFALLAFALPRRWMRAIAVALAVAAAAGAGGRFAYRLDAGEGGISGRGLLGSTHLAWKEVRRVDAGPALLLVWGPGDAQVRVDAGGFTPEQRATLDRIISRRVREAQAPDSRPGRP